MKDELLTIEKVFAFTRRRKIDRTNKKLRGRERERDYDYGGSEMGE
jgi:hypothetical protein